MQAHPPSLQTDYWCLLLRDRYVNLFTHPYPKHSYIHALIGYTGENDSLYRNHAFITGCLCLLLYANPQKRFCLYISSSPASRFSNFYFYFSYIYLLLFFSLFILLQWFFFFLRNAIQHSCSVNKIQLREFIK